MLWLVLSHTEIDVLTNVYSVFKVHREIFTPSLLTKEKIGGLNEKFFDFFKKFFKALLIAPKKLRHGQIMSELKIFIKFFRSLGHFFPL